MIGQVDASTQQSDPREARKRLKFPTAGERRARVAQVFTEGTYTASPVRNGADGNSEPLYRYNAEMETMSTQTEALNARTVAVGEGTTASLESDRTHELVLALPNPQDFPILTTGQLIEAQHRMTALISRLEAALVVATQEDVDNRRLARVAAGLEDANRPSLLSTEVWMKQFGSKIEARLRDTHHDSEGVAPPTLWSRSKIDDTVRSPSPPRQYRREVESEFRRQQILASPRRSHLDLDEPIDEMGMNVTGESSVSAPYIPGEDGEHSPPPPPPPEDDEDQSPVSSPPFRPSSLAVHRPTDAEQLLDDVRRAELEGNTETLRKKPPRSNKWSTFDLPTHLAMAEAASRR